ncbi:MULTISPECIES: hypothetical protein [unclassified Dietzia]|uniref:hypothetical protein n=1 Tax=unclassified Dietzia TaxID=2617939 RepID=UPI0015F94E15|nr:MULTISPECIES: hypothetical protein [unclassified Dietzia]MBB1042144.1 hypothetical protein [Dietzia sp. Cai40]MBB1045620.1 hypothetical protein [Dietzia sp. DQ11-44]MBB1050573.1 hypothetical protein [Dietzia sp. CW19]
MLSQIIPAAHAVCKQVVMRPVRIVAITGVTPMRVRTQQSSSLSRSTAARVVADPPVVDTLDRQRRERQVSLATGPASRHQVRAR